MKLNNAIDQRLRTAGKATTVALANAEIREYLAGYGYTVRDLREGKRLYENARGALKILYAATQRERAISARLDEKERRALVAYGSLASALGRSNGHTTPRATANFLRSAQILLNAADRAGVQVKRDRVAFAMCARVMEEHIAAKQWERDARRDRDAALIALGDWQMRFQKTARAALRGKPNLLRALNAQLRPISL